MIRLRHILAGTEYKIVNDKIEVSFTDNFVPSLLRCEDVVLGIVRGDFNIIRTAITKYPGEEL